MVPSLTPSDSVIFKVKYQGHIIKKHFNIGHNFRMVIELLYFIFVFLTLRPFFGRMVKIIYQDQGQIAGSYSSKNGHWRAFVLQTHLVLPVASNDFTIDTNTGSISVTSPSMLNYTNIPVYNLQVVVTDKGSTNQLSSSVPLTLTIKTGMCRNNFTIQCYVSTMAVEMADPNSLIFIDVCVVTLDDQGGHNYVQRPWIIHISVYVLIYI